MLSARCAWDYAVLCVGGVMGKFLLCWILLNVRHAAKRYQASLG